MPSAGHGHAVYLHSSARHGRLAVPTSASACPPRIATAPRQARDYRNSACAAAEPAPPHEGCTPWRDCGRTAPWRHRLPRHKIFQFRIKNIPLLRPSTRLQICNLRLNLFIPSPKHYQFRSYIPNQIAIDTHFSYAFPAALPAPLECGFPYAHIFLLTIMWTTPLPPVPGACRAPVPIAR